MPESFLYALDTATGISTITLNRPDRLNALTFEVYEELLRTFRALDSEPGVRVVVITGAGKAFCSGGDVHDIIGKLFERDARGLLEFTRMTCDLVLAIRQCSKPVVAALNGTTAGAGAVIASACDIRIAAASAKIAFLFTKVGLSGADMGAAWLLPRIVGAGRAAELLMTGDFITADEALRIGLYNRVVPDGEALTAATAFAEQLARGPARALAITKEALNREASLDLVVGVGVRGADPGGADVASRFPRSVRGVRREAAAEIPVMKITCVGGGPGGLYFAVLMKKADPRHEIRVIERNRPEDTFGFGVVFSDATMAGIAGADSDAYSGIARHLVHWDDIEVHYRGERITSTGHGFSGMSRHTLLRVLQEQACAAGVEMLFEREVSSLDAIGDADLVVAADGSNSTVRQLLQSRIATTVDLRPNRFVWLGTTKPFPAFTFYFRHDDHGLWRVHAYQYGPDRSTFIVECGEQTWRAAGMDRATEAETAAFLERLFAEELDGHRLITNRSIWRQFPTVRTEPWSSEQRRAPRRRRAHRAFLRRIGDADGDGGCGRPARFAGQRDRHPVRAARLRGEPATAGREPAARRAGVAAVVRGHRTVHVARPGAVRVLAADAVAAHHARGSARARSAVSRARGRTRCASGGAAGGRAIGGPAKAGHHD